VVTDTAKVDPDTFATGAGGGAAGDMAKIYEHKVTPKNARNLAKNTNRISTKSTTSSIALPDLPATSVSSMVNGMSAGGASKGFGGGSGGGIGSGKGAGVGNGRNFVGRPVMGAKILAQRIAVYLDASGSMRSYLPRVEEEIRKQFPEADIYRYNGAWTVVEDGDVVGGRRSRGKEINSANGDPASFTTDPKTLTPDGKSIFRKYDENFRRGSLGAWLDVMQHEKYDALIVFSDFQDGFVQIEKQTKIYHEYWSSTSASPTRSDVVIDTRKSKDMRWERGWKDTFNKAKTGEGPRLYCFTTQVEPQKLTAACVELSGGEIKNASWLRTGEPPPQPSADPNSGSPASQTTLPATTNQGYRPPR